MTGKAVPRDYPVKRKRLPSPKRKSMFVFIRRHLHSHTLSFCVLLLALAGLLIALPQAAPPAPGEVVQIIPTNTGQPERCLTCHNGIESISASHPTEDFGCVSCHGGLRLATVADIAHAGMVRNPGALGYAEQYCGGCHARQVVTVPRAIMATYAGAIASVRHTFGLQPDRTAHYATAAVDTLEAFTADAHDPQPIQDFAANCLNCHLHAESRQADYFYRSEGCSACHVLYGDDGLYRGGDPTIPRDEPGHPLQHTFTTAIPYSQCNHCHNRGNFDLVTMTFLERDDLPAPEGLSDRERRLHEYYQPIGRFTLCEWELDCIDCHTAREIMGDARLYDSRTAARYIQCATCHGTLDSPPQTHVVESPDDLALLRAALNPNVTLERGATVIDTGNGETFWHVQQVGERWILTGKATGEQYAVPLVMGSQCQQQPDQQDSHYCHECHTYDRQRGAG